MNIKNFLIISRANIQIASLPTAAMGITLAARSWNDFFRLDILVFVVLFFLILTFSCHINCLHDQDVDARFKQYMSHAVKRIGIPRLKKWIVWEAVFCIVTIVILAWIKHKAVYLLALGALLCGYLYSAKPWRIKKRGFISPLPVWLGLYFLPPVAGWHLIRGRLSVFILLFALGYSLLMQGITLINTCEDFAEDRLCGICTLAHVAGIRTTLIIGATIMTAGSVLDILLIGIHKFPYISREPLRIMAAISLAMYFLIQVLLIVKRFIFIKNAADCEAMSKHYASIMPKWFIKTRYSLLAIAMLAIG